MKRKFQRIQLDVDKLVQLSYAAEEINEVGLKKIKSEIKKMATLCDGCKHIKKKKNLGLELQRLPDCKLFKTWKCSISENFKVEGENDRSTE